MNKTESTQFVDVILEPLVSAAHFYGSMYAGWWTFHHGIYPLAYFAKGAGADLSAQLPIYALNVMAFGCMIYVMTRPFLSLLIQLLQAFEHAVNKLTANR